MYMSWVPFNGVGRILTKLSSTPLWFSVQSVGGISSSESCSMIRNTELLDPVIPVLVLGASNELFEVLLSQTSRRLWRVRYLRSFALSGSDLCLRAGEVVLYLIDFFEKLFWEYLDDFGFGDCLFLEDFSLVAYLQKKKNIDRVTGVWYFLLVI